MKKEKTVNFKPVPGIVLIDPILKVKKSDYMEVADGTDDPHRGIVVAIGDPREHDHDPSHLVQSPVKIGDLVLYSIVGIEKIRINHDGDKRKEFVIVPFNRCLGVIKK